MRVLNTKEVLEITYYEAIYKLVIIPFSDPFLFIISDYVKFARYNNLIVLHFRQVYNFSI